MSSYKAAMYGASGELHRPSDSALKVTASGSNTARTLSDRFGEVFHVDDYGAKGDWNGTTGTDDTAAIQAAINAAVANNGGVIRFGAGKKYRLNTRNSASADWGGTKNTHFLRVGSGSNTSGFGSTSMRLLFDGQGATLHATAFVDGQNNDILYTFCRFKEIQFRDLNFDRSIWKTAVNGAVAACLSFSQYDTNPSDIIRIENCYFNNHLHSIYFDVYFAQHVAWSDIYGKLKRLEVVGCRFEHPNGDGRERGFLGFPLGTAAGWPAVVIWNSCWIETAVYDRCYADGLINATVPLDYHEPMHGFLFPMPINCQITNCYFKNFYVEIIKATDIENADTLVRLQTGITQPSVGNTVTCSIAAAFALTNQKLTVGKLYGFYDNVDFEYKRGGIFKLEPKAGGGEYSYEPNSTDQLIFTRVGSSEYQLFGGQLRSDGSTYAGSWIRVLDLEVMDRMSLQVSNCCFDGSRRIVKEDGITPLVDSVFHTYSPAIVSQYKATINNNVFYNGGLDFKSDVSFMNHHGAIFSNNIVQKYTPTSNQINLTSLFTRRNNVHVLNNRFIYRESRAVEYVLFFGAHDIVCSGNSCIVLNPSAAGTNGVVTEPWFVNYDNNGPWRVIAEDNYLRDLGYYGNTLDGATAHFTGSVRVGIQLPSSATIRMAKQYKSPDGSTWTVGVTNDGELEVIK